MQTELLKEIRQVLQNFPQYWNGETLRRFDVVTAIENKEPNLIKAIISNQKLKLAYCADIDGVLLFDFAKLVSLIQYKEYWNDSYTKYKNKIGLTIGGNYLDYNTDVVLTFPFKDCTLEGGMSKAEVTNKDDFTEVYYNEVVASDEIDRLFSPKVLTKAVCYSKGGGVEDVTEFNDKDNLIIKGNNLLALHSLKERFRGRIKLIYIDPPFNTGSDDFPYNDKFNHSTWLTFMKNRLEIAKELLSDNGVISIHIGNEEVSYLQILLDEIFTRDNYLNHITITTNAPSGFKATSDKIFSTSNHIFLYAKDKSKVRLNKVYTPKEYDESYKYFILNPEDHFSKWKYTTILEFLAQKQNMTEKEYKNSMNIYELKEKIAKFADSNKTQVFRTAAIGGGAAKKRQDSINFSKENKGVVIQYENEDVPNFYILNGEQILFWSNVYNEIDGHLIPSVSLTDIWTDISFTGIAKEGGVKLKNAKKPELLLKRILEISTNKDDIVLDYHLGSGTTCAVAHKMGRQYIGIEQMDYIETLPVERLKNVIDGEQGGISKIVNWQSGGSFVYFELAKLNQIYVEKVSQADNTEQLLDILETMKAEAYLNYQIQLDKILQQTYEKDGVDYEVVFSQLSLAEQKEILIGLLDKNQLYINLSEMDDQNMQVSDSDKQFTQSFYQIAHQQGE